MLGGLRTCRPEQENETQKCRLRDSLFEEDPREKAHFQEVEVFPNPIASIHASAKTRIVQSFSSDDAAAESNVAEHAAIGEPDLHPGKFSGCLHLSKFKKKTPCCGENRREAEDMLETNRCRVM